MYQIASDLSLFGLPLFTVNDDAFYAGEAEMDPIRSFARAMTYRNVILTQNHYIMLKTNGMDNNEWLRTDHLALTTQWLCWNDKSLISDMYNIVQSDFVAILNKFYNFMINQEGSLNLAKDAWVIHRFLMLRSNLL